MSNGALSPATVTIRSGESVRFVNNHNRTHQMSSDPHPNHTDCPPINALPTLDPGQSGQTNGLTTVRTCGIHDHLNDADPSLRGSIIIQLDRTQRVLPPREPPRRFARAPRRPLPPNLR